MILLSNVLGLLLLISVAPMSQLGSYEKEVTPKLYKENMPTTFSPSNYYLDKSGDTVKILLSKKVQIKKSASSTIDLPLMGSDFNLSESFSAGHPSLAILHGSSSYLYVASETGEQYYEISLKEWKLERDGGILNMIDTDERTGFGYTGSIDFYYPEIAATSSRLMLVNDSRSGSNYYYAYSHLLTIPGLNSYGAEYLDGDSPVATPDVAPASSSGDDFYAIAVYMATSSDWDIRFYKTTDGGSTWNKATLWDNGVICAMPRISSAYDNRSKIVATWKTADTVLIGYSSNGGSNWTIWYLTGFDFPDIAVYSNTIVLVIQNGNTLYFVFSKDGGNSWNSNSVTFSSSVNYPAIATSPNGWWLVTFYSNDKVYYGYESDPSYFDSNSFLVISDDSYALPDRPSVVIDPTVYSNGWSIVAWKDSRSSTDIYGDCMDGDMVGIDETSINDSFFIPSILYNEQILFVPNGINEIVIYDLAGRTVFSKEKCFPNKEIKVELKKTGVYFISLKGPNKVYLKKALFVR